MVVVLRILIVLGLAAGFMVMAGCAAQREAAGEYLSDSAVTARVKKAIYDEPMLDVTDVSVRTVQGVVHLTGAVKSRARAVRASQVARRVEGVKDVKNDLQVQP